MRIGQPLPLLVSFCALAIACATPSLDAAAQPQPSCDAACLKGFVDGYIDALAHRDAAKLVVASDAKFTENGRVQTLGMGFWKTAGAAVDYRDYLVDPDLGGVAAYTALHEGDHVTELFVRLKVTNRAIAEIETLVVRPGDQRWYAPDNLEHLSDLFAQTVPDAQRHTREELIATANAYFTAVHTEGTAEFQQAPFAPGLKRYENGLQTTNNHENPVLERHSLEPGVQLEKAFYKGTHVMDRRFPLVDVEHGLVLGIATFRSDGADSSTLLLAETFKITDGRLREIRAMFTGLPNGAATGWAAAH
jgi:hypothetical protein